MENNKDLYAGYKNERYLHYREVHTGKFTTQNTRNGSRRVPIREQRIVEFEEIKALNLNSIGECVPTLDAEDFTMIQNYLLDFWGAVLGSECIQVYIHLRRHAYGKKDFCFPDIDTIALKMKKSKNFVKGCLKTLEEHNFIVIFNRRDTKDNNRSVSPLFKIRRFVPLLTNELYEELPAKLKKDHDTYMEDYKDIDIATNELKNSKVIEGLIENAELFRSKSQIREAKEKIEEENKATYIREKIAPECIEAGEKILTSLQERIAKPSFDVWFKDAVLALDSEKNSVYVLCAHDFAKTHVQDKFKTIIAEEVGKQIGFNVEDTTYIFKTHDEYIVEI
ncbi:helix-turn-helix domain-containing protein [Bacillus cereus]|uniref:DnaA N-terminal domain-containing protein n=1 Tax=Bacillus cereus HuA3-9 TaxID=1053205 RepID=R8CIE2_BACCE|nr:helix-turn-helix domain-containing protein [Bacillus cereus]EOO11404.1 hypothetical protein IGA_05667 [Bacillus cereus HuA3-9]